MLKREGGHLCWALIPELLSVLMQCITFSVCGKLVPVYGWLRVATGVLKRLATAITKRRDNIDDNSFQQMMAEMLTNVETTLPGESRMYLDTN